MPRAGAFKSLSIRKVDELVATGSRAARAGAAAHAGTHLEADAFHAMLQEADGGNTVLIDVRNQYESAIGHFAPPEDGATLIDPGMRNSRDFPNWLALPETRAQLDGKRVMMYCTGGIRCERASAFINQVAAADANGLKPAGVYELRGGIERYLKTYPDGGLWRGKNYLFDRRVAQLPAHVEATDPVAVATARCALCATPCDEYKGDVKCASAACAVPVIVCGGCLARGDAAVAAAPAALRTCAQGKAAPPSNAAAALLGASKRAAPRARRRARRTARPKRARRGGRAGGRRERRRRRSRRRRTRRRTRMRRIRRS